MVKYHRGPTQVFWIVVDFELKWRDVDEKHPSELLQPIA